MPSCETPKNFLMRKRQEFRESNEAEIGNLLNNISIVDMITLEDSEIII